VLPLKEQSSGDVEQSFIGGQSATGRTAVCRSTSQQQRSPEIADLVAEYSHKRPLVGLLNSKHLSDISFRARIVPYSSSGDSDDDC